jgi:WhiB family redox-sensing transcriptional regulator
MSTGQDWEEQARCREIGTEAFFPEKGEPNGHAKAVCRSCEVRTACLAAALERDERFGIWGGTSEYERRKMRRRKTTTAA